MKKALYFALISGLMILSACGGGAKEEKEEMQAHEDSIKKDTSINSSVDAANDFLNDTTAAPAPAAK